MKIKFSIVLLIMVLAIGSVYGQEVEAKKGKTVFAAKLYAASNFENINSSFSTIEIPKSFSPTISLGKEYGNYNEVELIDFRFVKSSFQKELALGSRYSYNWRLFSKSETSRFSYFIGAGASANYFVNRFDNPFIDNYKFRSRSFQMAAVIIPRVNMKIGKRMYLDLNIPYNVYGHSFYKNEFTNSTDQGNIDLALPDKFTVNIGVAIKF